jgi:hypothetical protein
MTTWALSLFQHFGIFHLLHVRGENIEAHRVVLHRLEFVPREFHPFQAKPYGLRRSTAESTLNFSLNQKYNGGRDIQESFKEVCADGQARRETFARG